MYSIQNCFVVAYLTFESIYGKPGELYKTWLPLLEKRSENRIIKSSDFDCKRPINVNNCENCALMHFCLQKKDLSLLSTRLNNEHCKFPNYYSFFFKEKRSLIKDCKCTVLFLSVHDLNTLSMPSIYIYMFGICLQARRIHTKKDNASFFSVESIPASIVLNRSPGHSCIHTNLFEFVGLLFQLQFAFMCHICNSFLSKKKYIESACYTASWYVWNPRILLIKRSKPMTLFGFLDQFIDWL